jgi:hypothetical protein
MADFSAWVEKNKGLWTRVYDEVIAPDFEAEWKKSKQDRHVDQKPLTRTRRGSPHGAVEAEWVSNTRDLTRLIMR